MAGFFSASGFEGIAYNPYVKRFYLLIESRETKKGKFRSEIFESDDSLTYVNHRPIDFSFKSKNKGFECLAHIRRDGRDYVLGLCEGNKCKGGSAGRRPGDGPQPSLGLKNQ